MEREWRHDGGKGKGQRGNGGFAEGRLRVGGIMEA